MIRGESSRPLKLASSFSLAIIVAVIFGHRGRFLNQIKAVSLKMKG